MLSQQHVLSPGLPPLLQAVQFRAVLTGITIEEPIRKDRGTRTGTLDRIYMNDFGLRRLEVMLAYISTSQGIGNTFPIGRKSRVNASAKAILNRRSCAFAKDLANNSRNSASSSNASGGRT
jgi:hypothetical protein